jgi:hypothetical protein
LSFLRAGSWRAEVRSDPSCVKCGTFIGDLHRPARDTGASARTHSDPSSVDPVKHSATWPPASQTGSGARPGRRCRTRDPVLRPRRMGRLPRVLGHPAVPHPQGRHQHEWDGYGRAADLADLTLQLHRAGGRAGHSPWLTPSPPSRSPTPSSDRVWKHGVARSVKAVNCQVRTGHYGPREAHGQPRRQRERRGQGRAACEVTS